MSDSFLYNRFENIIAEMTPPGRGAISGIRISGNDSKTIVEKVFNIQIKEPRHSYFISHVLDDLIIIYYKAPASYTGEDVCEIYCHGNPQIVTSILDNLLSVNNVRIAAPGEFTKRAFLNGKIDLLQAESVAELINSNTTVSVNYNAKILRGDLSKILEDTKSSLTNQAVHSELEIDFEDEAQPVFSYDQALKIIKEKQCLINDICSSFSTIERIAKDTQVLIHGTVNVGKSSLFNRLLNSNRSITHHEPGTTRDYIEAKVIWDGLDIVLIDTAGIRHDSTCKIENEGIARVKELINEDSIIVEVADKQDYVFNYQNSIKVINKNDQLNIKNKRPDILYISALQNQGIDLVKKEIINKILEKNINNKSMENAFIVSKRQKKSFLELNSQLSELVEEISSHKPVDIVSFRINKCIALINKILGLEHSSDAVLDELFSKFCIGK